MSNEFKPGDIVRVIDPDQFLQPLCAKLTNREGVVEWVGPDAHGQFEGQMWVRFLKRNGRGKEFRERMYCDYCEAVAMVQGSGVAA